MVAVSVGATTAALNQLKATSGLKASHQPRLADDVDESQLG